jgi:hypothetical protein
LRCWNTENGIVIEGVIFMWPVIGDLVAGVFKVLHKHCFEFETSVIASNVYAHGFILPYWLSFTLNAPYSEGID